MVKFYELVWWSVIVYRVKVYYEALPRNSRNTKKTINSSYNLFTTIPFKLLSFCMDTLITAAWP